MENPQVEKKAKSPSKSSSYGTLRVRKATRKRILEDLAKANRKDFGRRVKADEYIALAVSRITPQDIATLQERSLSHADRFERDYREYVAKNGALPKDEYLGKRLKGELSSSIESASKNAIIDGKINGLEPNLVAPIGGK